MHPRTILVTTGLAVSLSAFACKSDKSSSDSKAAPSTASEPASPTTSEEPGRSGRKRDQKDKGMASVKIDGIAWSAERASASLKDGKLTIRASRMELADGKAKRQELQLHVDNFAGPGDYKTGVGGSRFIGVGLDTKAVASDEAAKAEATRAVSNASHVLLSNAQVHIASANDQEVTGTFSWQPQASGQPVFTDGSFRAPMK